MLKLASNLHLPIEAVTQTFALLARRGAGKTYTGNVLAEEMLEGNFPIVVIDPIGVWWGLRSKYPIAILGGEHADAPLESTAGKLVAEFAVAQRLPIILDVSAFGENEMRRFVGDFAQRFYQINRQSVHVFIDEADEFAPQTSFGGDQAKCLGALQNLVRRGRARGIGVTLITQRSAVLNKSVLTQAEVLIAMQTTGPQDLKAIDDWIKYHGTPEQRDTIMHSLPKLQQGEGWVYSPGWLKLLKQVKFRTRHSFDSSRTPKPGEQKTQPRNLAEVDLSKLTKEMAATIEKAKADDPKLLRQKIAELERKLKTAPVAAAKPAGAVFDRKSIERAVAKAVAARDQQWQPIVKRAIGLLEKSAAPFDAACTALRELAGMPTLPTPAVPESQTSAKPALPRPEPRVVHGDGDAAVGKKGAIRKILTALAQHPEGLKYRKIGVFAGVSTKGGSFSTYLSRCRSNGWIDGNDTEGVTITADGLAALGSYDPLPTGRALADHWLKEFGEGAAGKIFKVVIDAYPASLSHEEINARSGVSIAGGSYSTYLSRLRSRDLITGSKEIKASDDLFI